MKNHYIILLELLLIFTLLFTACTPIEGDIASIRDKLMAPSFIVIFNANGGIPAPVQQTVSSGDTIIRPPVMVKEGYIFDGWYKEETFTTLWVFSSDTVNSNITLYAKWITDSPVSCIIRFEANGGSPVPGNQSVAQGAKISSPQTITREGYAFEGWYRESAFTTKWNFSIDTVSNSMTLYAKWNVILPDSFIVTFIANNGIPAPNQQSINHGDKVSPPSVMSREGYTFDGWYRESSFSTRWDFAIDIVTNDIILYAKWTEVPPDSFTVRFDKNAVDAIGSMADSIFTLGIAQPLPLNGFTRSGYTFNGWSSSFSGPAEYGDQSNVFNLSNAGATVILYAQWTANTYMVAYNGNGGSGTMGNMTHTYGTAKNLEVNIFTRIGYTFTGWALDSDGLVVFTNQQSVSNLNAELGAIVTLYAQWTGFTWYIAYNANNGTGSINNSTHIYGTAKSLTANTFSRTGYSFAGWARTEHGAVEFTDKQSIISLSSTAGSTVTLYAQWLPDTFTIIYRDAGNVVFSGTHGTSYPVSHTYDTATSLIDPSKKGYNFGGWFLNSSAEGTALTILSATDYTANITLYAKWSAIPVSGVVLDTNTLTIGVGESRKLIATVQPADALYNAVSWNSNNIGVANVTQDGTVNALSAGTATITVTTTDGNKTAQCTVTVQQAEHLTVSFIAEGAPVIIGPIIYRSAENGLTTAIVTVDTPDHYSSIDWYIGSEFMGSGESIILNSAHYNIGEHFLTVEVLKEAVPYSRVVSFLVAP